MICKSKDSNDSFSPCIGKGNLLIRPAQPGSKSPYNFEIVLLDHGLYFDIDAQLRVNYGKLWLSLIAPGSPSTNADRRKYAELVGNVSADLVGFADYSREVPMLIPLECSTPFLRLLSPAEQLLKEHGVMIRRNRRFGGPLA